MRILLAQLNPIVGDMGYNLNKIQNALVQAREQRADIVLTPELALCGYPPEDLLVLPSFVCAIEKALQQLLPLTQGLTLVVGCVRRNLNGGEKGLYNSAAVMHNGRLLGFYDKILLPDYDVFSEGRYFEPGGLPRLFDIAGVQVAVTICEDIWQHARAVEYSHYPRDPVEEIKGLGCELLLNLSASPYYLSRHSTRLRVCEKVARTLDCPVILCNQVGGNDSLIFDGYSLCVDSGGNLAGSAPGFQETCVLFDTEQTQPINSLDFEPVEDLYRALVLGIRDYFHKLGFKKGCLGLSGGIDSAVVVCLAREALGGENLLALLLPSRYTAESSTKDAYQLAHNLSISLEEISIEKPFSVFLEQLSPYFSGAKEDATEENMQARIRALLLMAFSNKFGYLLLSTGNKSEMAMGYSTLYGDMCGGLAVLSDVTKEQVYELARYINRKQELIPQSIINKPPSAELRWNQKDSDTLPEYPIVDRVLQDYVEEHLSPEEIAEKHALSLSLVKELVRKIHLNEYKRRQAPPGLRVTKKSFTIGRRYPIVQHWNMSW